MKSTEQNLIEPQKLDEDTLHIESIMKSERSSKKKGHKNSGQNISFTKQNKKQAERKVSKQDPRKKNLDDLPDFLTAAQDIGFKSSD